MKRPEPPKTPPVRIIKEGDTGPGWWSKFRKRIPEDEKERSFAFACFSCGFHLGVLLALLAVLGVMAYGR